MKDSIYPGKNKYIDASNNKIYRYIHLFNLLLFFKYDSINKCK